MLRKMMPLLEIPCHKQPLVCRGPGVGFEEDKKNLYPFFKTVHVKLAVKSFLCTPPTLSVKKLNHPERE